MLTPGCDSRHPKPAAAIGSIRPNTRSRIAGQSTVGGSAWIPYRLAPRISRATSAVWTNIFDGMQPSLRHVPPNGSPSSISATLRREKRSSMIEFPLPEPMTARST